MSRKKYTPEQIIGKLREAEVALSQGQTTAFKSFWFHLLFITLSASKALIFMEKTAV